MEFAAGAHWMVKLRRDREQWLVEVTSELPLVATSERPGWESEAPRAAAAAGAAGIVEPCYDGENYYSVVAVVVAAGAGGEGKSLSLTGNSMTSLDDDVAVDHSSAN